MLAFIVTVPTLRYWHPLRTHNAGIRDHLCVSTEYTGSPFHRARIADRRRSAARGRSPRDGRKFTKYIANVLVVLQHLTELAKKNVRELLSGGIPPARTLGEMRFESCNST
jgi:hypothetical protein